MNENSVEQKEVVTQPPQKGMDQPGDLSDHNDDVAGAAAVVSQPVAFTQGSWVKPDLCGLACDHVCCFAFW